MRVTLSPVLIPMIGIRNRRRPGQLLRYWETIFLVATSERKLGFGRRAGGKDVQQPDPYDHIQDKGSSAPA